MSRIAKAIAIFGGLLALQATAWLGIGPLAEPSRRAPEDVPSDVTFLAALRSDDVESPTTLARASRSARNDDSSWRDLGQFKITCYVLRGTTKSGVPASAAVVAVDPKVIRLGSDVWVDGFGKRLAADTGRLIEGRHIDVWMHSYRDCKQFGVQRRAVWLDTRSRS